jgi:hypothetical protein
MPSNRYTNAMLTVIAGCLLWICAMSAGRAVEAQQPTMLAARGGVQPVVVVGTGVMDANGKISIAFVTRGNTQVTDPTFAVTLPYNDQRPLPVRLPYSESAPLPAQLLQPANRPVPMEIQGVRKGRDWDPIRAQVEDAPVRRTPGGGS